MYKNIIITGGTSGIGLSFIKLYINNYIKNITINSAKNINYNVNNLATTENKLVISIISRNKNNVASTIKNLSSLSSSIIINGISCDITDSVSINESIKSIYKTYGSIDLLVNSAGICKNNLLITQSDESIISILNTNLLGSIYTCRSVLRYGGMLKSNYGNIINIGSIITKSNDLSGLSVYAASKSGIEGFTSSFANELKDYNIQVNCIQPGLIENTEMFKLADLNKLESYKKLEDDNRFKTTEDVAKFIYKIIDERDTNKSGFIYPVKKL